MTLRQHSTEIAGYTGSIGCIGIVNGEVELGVDLEQARFEDVDIEARTVTLFLPVPTVCHARLDQERTTVYSLDRRGLWVLLASDEAGRRVVNVAMAEAQLSVEAAARDVQFINQAWERARRVLHGAFDAIGWEVNTNWTRIN